LQDVSFGEIPPNQVVKKLKREYIEVLNHIINIKVDFISFFYFFFLFVQFHWFFYFVSQVSDLINRMDNKVKQVPLNTIVKCARVIFPRIKINGNYNITIIVYESIKLYNLWNNKIFFIREQFVIVVYKYNGLWYR